MVRSRWFKRIRYQVHRKSVQKKLIRGSVLCGNLIIIIGIAAVVLGNTHNAQAADVGLTTQSSDGTFVANPLDQVSSANIALTIAQVDNLPEATAIANTAQSQAAELAIAASSNSVISKPQVVATALKSRANISYYVTKPGDTVASIAAAYGVTSDSISWSNNLLSGSVAPNQKLVIPPVTGIVYVVKAGDTPASLAQKYSASASQIIAYNDAEITGLSVGEQIIIPGGSEQSQAVYTASASSGSGSSFPWGGGPIYGYNGYDYGYCTWYVASVIPVPSNWGNAATWAYYAALSGWTVSTTPQVGSIAQTAYAAGGEGHVAIVQAVSADGSQIKISDMNGIAGWGRVGYSGWIPATTFQHFIYR